MPQTDPIEIFYSYSHKDESLRDELDMHLSMRKRQNLITGWFDREIEGGEEFEPKIMQHLNSASVILLLVSPAFIASDYCYEKEMARAMERHEAGNARVIPVILRKVDDWKDTPFAKLQALPTDGKPVMSWGDEDDAFSNVARGIRKVIENWGKRDL